MNDDRSFDSHNVTLLNRNTCELTGIVNVISFDDISIFATSCLGDIEIEGNELKINNFSSDKGTLSVSGVISGIYYIGQESTKKSRKKKDSARI